MSSNDDPSKVCLITGAGSGIGQATAVALAQQGYHLILAGRRGGRLDATADLAGKSSGRILTVVTDVSNDEAVRTLFQRARDEFGRLDVLFNNAGMNVTATPLEDFSADAWRQIVDVNLTGVFLCTREAFRLMKSQVPMGGRIINNGSISAYVPRPYSIAYNATKHAVTGLTKSTSLEGRAYKIACGQIDIGNAQTDLSMATQAQGALQANGTRFVEPSFDVREVARAIVYMTSLPLDANVQFMTVMATQMPYIGRG